MPLPGRKLPRLLLDPTGSYWLLNLHTGHRLKCWTFTPLHIPAHVIDRVHELAKADNQNPIPGFFYYLGDPIDDGDTPNNDNDAGSLSGVEDENDDINKERNEN